MGDPDLKAWEVQRDSRFSALAREREWPEEPTLQTALDQLQSDFAQYADSLASIVGVEK